MKKINIFLGCFLLVFSFNIHAQVSIEWQKSLGDSSSSEYPVIIKPTTGGGYIVAGTSVTKDQYGSKALDVVVIKLNNTGDAQWQKILGESNRWEIASNIEQTSDGGYIAVSVKGNYDTDYWIVKMNASGDIIWEKFLGGYQPDDVADIQQTTDGGYIVAGTSSSNDGDVTGNKGGSDYWVVKLNGSGTIIWKKSLGGSGYENAHSIRQTIDGGYIVAGETTSNDGDVTGNHGVNNGGYQIYHGNAWIVKLNSTGTIQWQKCLGGNGEFGEIAYSIEQTTDSGYVFAGRTCSNNGDVSGYHGGYYDCWIVKLNSAGDLQWQKCLGGYDQEQAYSIKQTPDAGYIVAGYTQSESQQVSGNHDGTRDFWIVKLNTSGDLLWQKCLGGSGEEFANAIDLTTDGGYIVSGSCVYSNLPDDGDVTGKQIGLDFWVVKLAAEPLMLVPATTTVTKNITGNSATNVDSLNYRLVTLTPTGGAPNALSGDVATTVTVNSTISTFNNLPFVRRHYDITPSVNPANAQAIVTLYFTQHDFDLFNAYVTTNNLNIPLLPTGGVDNSNLRITQFHGNFTGTSDPANYNGGTTLIAPPALVVTWNNTNNYWIVSFPVTHFSGFYLSTVDLIVLPLTLLEFKGSLQESGVSLQWSTTNEINTREFVIERNNNSTGYTAIGKVSAQSTAGNHHYQFSDANPLEGNNFYRLKMADKDGNFNYSNTVVIKKNNVVSKIIVYPNPSVNNLINLQFINQLKGIYNLRLINYLGQVIHTKQISHTEGSLVESLTLNSSIQKGHYVLEVIAPDNSKHLLKIIF